MKTRKILLLSTIVLINGYAFANNNLNHSVECQVAYQVSQNLVNASMQLSDAVRAGTITQKQALDQAKLLEQQLNGKKNYQIAKKCAKEGIYAGQS